MTFQYAEVKGMVRKKEIYPNELQTKLSKLWLKNPEEWKQYHTIRDFLKQNFHEFKNLSERTIMRYLSHLVEIGFLEKKVELSHRTWYKPKKVAFQKTVLKEKIDSLEDLELLNDYNTFTLLLLTEYAKNPKRNILQLIESAKEGMLELKKAQKQIEEAYEKLKATKEIVEGVKA